MEHNSLRDALWRAKIHVMGRFFPKRLVDYRYYAANGKHIDWNNPQTFDEKVNWTKFYSDTSLWPVLADKYAVRQFVEERGLGDTLVKLYGHWEKASEICWEKLPQRFIMKVNNGSGDVVKCTDKDSFDKRWCEKHFDKLLASKFGYDMGEYHYAKIKPCVVAEELLDAGNQAFVSSTLIDYKILSFDGKPAYIWVCFNRTPHTVDVGVYDLDWNFHPEYSVSTDHYRLYHRAVPRPKALDEMLHIASVLSKGFPFVRVDLYEVGGRPYFGEMTFTPSAGFNTFFSDEFQKVLGGKFSIK